MTSSESGPSSSEPESPVRPDHINYQHVIRRRTPTDFYRVFEVKTTYILNFTQKGDVVVACFAPVSTNREGNCRRSEQRKSCQKTYEQKLASEMEKDGEVEVHSSPSPRNSLLETSSNVIWRHRCFLFLHAYRRNNHTKVNGSIPFFLTSIFSSFTNAHHAATTFLSHPVTGPQEIA
jgi:hypothetical protein